MLRLLQKRPLPVVMGGRVNIRCVMAVFAAAGLACSASGQEIFKITYSWSEVAAGTTTPATGPLGGNGVVDPGEGARISISINILKNGQNAIGQTTTYATPPAPGTGVIAGLGSFLYNLFADAPGATAGTWTHRGFPSFVSGANNWAGTTVGLVVAGGIENFGTGQFLAPGATANATNPLAAFYSATWNPADYVPRTVRFRVSEGVYVPTGQVNGVIVRYDIARPDPNDPSTWYDLYATKFFGADYGAGAEIPVAPAPGLGLPLLAALAFCRRNRPI